MISFELKGVEPRLHEHITSCYPRSSSWNNSSALLPLPVPSPLVSLPPPFQNNNYAAVCLEVLLIVNFSIVLPNS